MKARVVIGAIVLVGGLVWLGSCVSTQPPSSPLARQALQSFTLHEAFGVSHPTQIIDFDLQRKVDPARCKLVDTNGAEVVYQLLDGGRKIAVLTDLPAGGERTWYLIRRPKAESGMPRGPGLVTVTEADEAWEIDNGLTGVRAPRPLAGARSYDLSSLPAPVQGVRMRDGSWSATGPNRLQVEANQTTAMDVRFLEKGPLKIVVEVSYQFDRPEYVYGNQKVTPAGPGYYRSTITVEAGQPSILFEEDTDMNVSWSLDFYDAVHPTNARYRGHHARSKEAGYEPDGQTYRMWHARSALDAQVDLRYDRPMPSSYSTHENGWRWMAVWDPWAFDSGWYWQMFDAQAPANANLVGIFAGRASRAIGASFSGTGLYTLPAREDGSPQAGFTVQSSRRGADARVSPRTRYQWGLFVSTKADLAPPEEVQPINRQMNLHAGISLAKVHRYQLDFRDPPRGYGSLYMDKEAVQRLVDRLRADPGGVHGGGFHGYLYNVEPTSRPLIDLWADATGDKTHQAAKAVADLARDLLNSHVHGEGIYSMSYHYWHGGLAMMRQGVWIDQVLATDVLTPEERAQVKAAAVLFANVLWDDDFVPLFGGHGLNLGTANMPVQQYGYRDFYALLLAEHPTMRDRAKSVRARTLETVRDIINEHGAEMGCTHYIGASFAPTLNTLLQLKQLGGDDLFATEPRLARFAEFYLHFLTPPEPRVGGKRCFIPLGDSGVEPSEMYGTLGTGFRDADPKLSARLMGAWQAGGKPHSGFFGTTLLMIDDTLPAADPALGDATFPGYYTVLRHGWGTTNETAVWTVNGDFYSDHRHHDHGSVVIYALGKPLSVDWGAIYTPQAPGGYYHSGVVLEDSLGQSWDQDSPPLSAGGGWHGSTPDAFVSFPEGAYVRSRFTTGKTTWTRAITSVRADAAHPVIVIRDTFEGENAAAPKVMTLNLMATGEVDTPAGKITPPPRTHAVAEHKDGTPGHELASATPPFALKPGANRFGFTGRDGLDCDVFVLSDQPQQALLGNWADQAWGGHVTDREERQHILRVRGTGSFTAVILPWRKGEKPDSLTVTPDGGDVVVQTAAGTTRIHLDGFTAPIGDRTVERSFRAE